MIRRETISIQGASNRPILVDYRFKEDGNYKPVVLFCHGFKGFKDFACFNLIAEQFAEAGFVYIKFNFSHNGTSVEDACNFVDLAAFSENTFSKELQDLDLVISWIISDSAVQFPKEINSTQINLIGHSRGGGISILQAAKDPRISKLITWAAVNSFDHFWKKELLEQWKKDGIRYEKNARTNQEMPLKYSLYEDFLQNREALSIEQTIKKLSISVLLVHGAADETVSVEQAKKMIVWNPKLRLKIIENGNHTFGAKHPWEESFLPEASSVCVQESIKFLKFAEHLII